MLPPKNRASFEGDPQLQSEQKLKYLLQEIPLGIIECNNDFKVIHWNPAAERIFGYSAADAIGQDAIFVFPSSARTQARQTWGDMLSQRGVERRTSENIVKDGRTIVCEWRSTPVVAPGGQVTGFTSFVQDVTERKKSEDEHYRSRQMLQLILDTIPQRIFWKDRNFSYLGCNKPFAVDAGLDDPGDILGKDDFELSWSDVAQAYRDDDRSVMETDTPKLSFEEPQTKPDGSQLWLKTSKVPLHDQYGQVFGVLGTYEDITQRKRAEGELHRSRQMLQLVLDTIPQRVFWKDRNLTFLGCNKPFASDLGLDDPSDIVGKDDFDLGLSEVTRQQCEYERLVIENDAPKLDFEESLITPGGRQVWLRTSRVPLHDHQGKAMGILVSFEDITERKRSEEIISQQAREILEISTPVVQLWEGVLAVPLIGMLDSERTQQITERLLYRIVETDSPIAIIDLTGVPMVDTQTGRHLIDTIAAVKLLGTKTLLTGIRPEIAQTLVRLGIDLTGIVTRSSLSSGLRYALDALDLEIRDKALRQKTIGGE